MIFLAGKSLFAGNMHILKKAVSGWPKLFANAGSSTPHEVREHLASWRQTEGKLFQLLLMEVRRLPLPGTLPASPHTKGISTLSFLPRLNSLFDYFHTQSHQLSSLIIIKKINLRTHYHEKRV